MENNPQINVAQICTVQSFLRVVETDFIYKTGKKSIFGNRKAGFYYWLPLGNPHYYSNEEILSTGRYIIEGEWVLFKPHIDIIMSSGKKITKYFDNEIEIYFFMSQSVMQDVKWINKIDTNFM